MMASLLRRVKPPRARSLSSLVTKQMAGAEGSVAVLRMDDGKMNAFSFEMLSQLTAVHVHSLWSLPRP